MFGPAERRAHELGIRAVPAFVFDERYGVSGAQPHAVLAETPREMLMPAEAMPRDV